MSYEGRFYLFWISVVVLAHHVAASSRALRGLAWLLLYGLAADLSRRAVRLWVLSPWTASHSEAPLTGWLRAAGHLSQGLFLGWGAGVLALAVWTFAERRSWAVALVLWAGAWLGAVLDYPNLRGEALGRYYQGWTVAVVGLGVLCILRFLVQGRRPRRAHVAAFWVLAIETSLLLGPYLGREPFTVWWTGQIAYAALCAGLIPVLVWRAVWKPKS